ncbi:putative toxin-antitoxin system toxin component, PIN family [Paracraurococcus lichenis]|uniref:Toxin-antitoxin system toxin component, PIN family n=1 Tax=Paracraurococcus lichenis TaxID=3064888 RepID=A0ABT9DWU9_9PROT|nr:putative toxin-antitoxin system toxin component, PIN family [Paracraurococcus sp. LOR1-02]MDO9708363.1 putative toxin-antitoxin system toxin component, PIN family [Paracraurococcus sp. LOR1-02]
MIVFDASTVIGAALRADSVPERALLRAEETDLLALSTSVEAEIAAVLGRPRFVEAIPAARRARILDVLRRQAAWFEPAMRVTDCRDAKDNKYLELALASRAGTIVSSDLDLLVLHPWRGVRILRPVDYLAQAAPPA